MREQGKYFEPCTECGSTHWQAQKKQVKMAVTYRYRTCIDCGHKIRTKQLPGEEETFYAECNTSGPRPKHDFVPEEHGLNNFIAKLNEDRKQKVQVINHSTGEVIEVDWSMDDALKSFDKNWKNIIGE